VRAYTDSVAQALLKAEKVQIVRMRTIRCAVPYAMEGMVRRELDAAGAMLVDVAHGDEVTFEFALAEGCVDEFIANLGETGHGRLRWLSDE
jgi:putative IMPACT (imprinted ancient) family translation regulator